MKREQFEAVLVADGWEKDRFGHYHKTDRWRTQRVDSHEMVTCECKYRVKMQDLGCRIEVQVRRKATEYSPAKNEWVRFGGAYYSEIVQLDNGRVRVGTHLFNRRNLPCSTS